MITDDVDAALAAAQRQTRIILKGCDINAEQARSLAENKIDLIGTDALSFGETYDEQADVHKTLLGAGIVLLEGLCLSAADCGSYTLVALPLKLKDCDGSPSGRCFCHENHGDIHSHTFCNSKCAYCDFVSAVRTDDEKAEYFNRLKEDISGFSRNEATNDRVVDSIYIGGGTPSCVDAGYIADTLGALRSAFDVSANAEISIEANPESLTAYTYIYFSMGLQAASDELLAAIGRRHTVARFRTLRRHCAVRLSRSVCWT